MSKELKKLRKDKRMTVHQAAKELGFTDRQYRLCEKDILQARATQIIKLAKFYSVSADYILGLNNHKNQETTDTK